MRQHQEVLLIEDAADVQTLVSAVLAGSDARLTVASTGGEASRLARQRQFDLILLDIHLPDQDGFELFIELQKAAHPKEIQVIFLTGSADASDKVTAFSLGAEDYIVKPFNILEFRARIEAKLRKLRARSEQAGQYRIDEFRFDLPAQKAFLAPVSGSEEREIELGSIEFRLFYHLAKHPDRIFSRDRILGLVWGDRVHVSERTVDTHVCTLRKKLRSLARRIQSVPGAGYRYVPGDESALRDPARFKDI